MMDAIAFADAIASGVEHAMHSFVVSISVGLVATIMIAMVLMAVAAASWKGTPLDGEE